MYHIPVFSSAGPRFSRLLIMVIALASYSRFGLAQDRALIPDSSIPIPPLQFDSSGALLIKPSSTSSQHDFDFLVGTWKLRNRKLTSRLTHSTEWKSFESQVEMHQILNGFGNIDKYTDQAAGKSYEGVAIRLFDPATRLWSIYWADSNSGKLDPPVVGSFENKIGHSLPGTRTKASPSLWFFAGTCAIRSYRFGAKPSPPT